MCLNKLLQKAEGEKSYRELLRYLRFIERRRNVQIKGETHRHHILPKASDFFPEYSNFKENPWNLVHLTFREHFIAHWMLARAFPNSSQSIAFYHFCNFRERKSSRCYEESRRFHIERLRRAASNPERCRKISESLKGKSKSEEHKKKLMGHKVSQKSRESVRQASLGRKWTEKQRERFILAKTGSKRSPPTTETKEKIRESKLKRNLSWFNNGTKEKLFPKEDVPEGWVKGKLKGTIKGRKHYNNGKESKLFLSPPDSTWTRGRLMKRNKS